MDVQSLLILSIILVSIISTMRSVLKNRDLNEAVDPIFSRISTIITFFIVVLTYESIDPKITLLLKRFFSPKVSNSGIINILVLGVIFIVIKLLIQGTLSLLNKIFFSNLLESKKNRFILCIFSIIFGVIRGFIFIILAFMSISIYNMLVSSDKSIGLFNNNSVYMKVVDIVDKSQVVTISNGIHEKVAANKVIYYNGITIEDGIKSNDEIDLKAKELVKGEKSEKAKDKTIYTWIGSNISYDDKKAELILNEGKDLESGAIVAFRTRKGICLDYACLYTAMAKSVGLKTRIIVGKAYNGQEYVSHSWNQVYLSKENRWVNLDTTFYVAGDYFDSNKFEVQYKTESIAGEF